MTVYMGEIVQNNKFSIIEVLLLDHRYLKECIKTLENEYADKKLKLKHGKSFLDALHKHSEAEKKSVYAPLIKLKDFKMAIIEGEIEHGIADTKVKMLTSKLTGLRTLTDELEVELKVLAELVEHHIKEEESEIIPKMRKNLDKTILNEIGFQFMKLRSFTAKDLRDYPKLQEVVSGPRKLGHRLSSKFVGRVQKQAGKHPVAHSS